MRWRIKGLEKQIPFYDAGKIILLKRLKELLKSIDEYFNDIGVEKLHKIRIALRRLRYNLEIFYCCFDKKIFISIYKNIQSLQDITGELRDLDVLKENISTISGTPDFIKEIDNKREELKETVGLELMKFIHNKDIKDFRNQLK
jgi:CHAD domain-containing protein